MTTRDAGTALRHARHRLVEHGEVPVGLIDDLVARSWQRCFHGGLAPVGHMPEVPHLSAAELARVTARA